MPASLCSSSPVPRDSIRWSRLYETAPACSEDQGSKVKGQARHEKYLVLGILEVEDKTPILILVLWVDVLMEVEQLLLDVMSNGFHFALLQIFHICRILTTKNKQTERRKNKHRKENSQLTASK